MPFFMPLFGRDSGALFVAGERATAANTVRPFPGGVAAGDLAIAYFGARQQPRVRSAGTYWARAMPTQQTSFSRVLTAADLTSGYTPDEEMLLVVYRGARSVVSGGGEDVGQGPTRQVSDITKPPGHVGLVALLYGAAPPNSAQMGEPVDPAPWAQRVQGGYSLTATDFATGIWDRLAPVYVDRTPITWTPSAPDGNGISIFQLIA